MTKQELIERMGGFMKGVCHPGPDPEPSVNLGVGWVRWDVPYPYDEAGNPTPDFLRYKRVAEAYLARGIRTIAISPYPRAFLAHGIDPSTEEGLAQVEETCRRMACDLGEAAACWQATNEMFVPHFRAPLDSEGGARFCAASIRGLRRADTGALIGQNNFGQNWGRYAFLIEELSGGSDYVGVDCYAGTWGKGSPDSYIPVAEKAAEESGLPVIFMEFGFNSSGDMIDLSMGADCRDEKLLAYLRRFGFEDGRDVLSRPDEWAEKVLKTESPVLYKAYYACAPVDRAASITGGFPHLLRAWPAVGYAAHTEANQAKFYDELLPRLMAHPSVAGAVVYCLKDSPKCFTCGHDDCPLEMTWGLIRCDGTPKPAYKSISDIFLSAPGLSE